MVDWLYIGYCTVMAMFAVAVAYAAVVGLRALRRLPRSLLLGFAAAAVVATLTAQKTNNVPPNMNQPQMMQGGVQIINSWCANRSSLGDVAAWMRANDNMNGRNACAIRLLQGGKIEYRYFRRDGRGWNLRSKYLEIVEEINL